MKTATMTGKAFVEVGTNGKSAKALGFKKGDLVHTGFFPGVIVGDVHTKTPLVEVWGTEQEIGGAYAHDLQLLGREEFFAHLRYWEYDPATVKAQTEIAQEAIKKALA